MPPMQGICELVFANMKGDLPDQPGPEQRRLRVLSPIFSLLINPYLLTKTITAP
jgi:hypothetical protein